MASKLAKKPSREPQAGATGDGADVEEVDDIDESSEVIPYRFPISFYGADYPVDGLVKRMNAHNIIVPDFDPKTEEAGSLEGFQRQFIWSKNQCDRFVESLLLGLPVPGIFLVDQPDGRLLVLDGQQRLRTLQAFYRGILRGHEFRLENVQVEYKGRTYPDLDFQDRRRLDDSLIHGTIVRQDESSDDQSSIYLIFERLNSGGTSLEPQEIRVALYRGRFVKLLRKLNEQASWRRLYGRKSYRLKDQELILRFFALFYKGEDYHESMKEFLNRFIGENRELQLKPARELEELFRLTCDLILSSIGDKAFRLERAVNAAVLDSVMVGVAKRLISGKAVRDRENLRQAYKSLLKKEDYQNSVVKPTGDELHVKTRLRLAIESFSKVP